MADQLTDTASLCIADTSSDPEPVDTAITHNPHAIKAIIAMAESGKTQTEIAHAYGVHQSTVSRIIKDWAPTTEQAERYARAKALGAVESLEKAFKGAEKAGKHGPQATLLQVAGVLKKDDHAGPIVQVFCGGDATQVQIGVVSTAPSPSVSPDSHRLSAEPTVSSV